MEDRTFRWIGRALAVTTGVFTFYIAVQTVVWVDQGKPPWLISIECVTFAISFAVLIRHVRILHEYERRDRIWVSSAPSSVSAKPQPLRPGPMSPSLGHHRLQALNAMKKYLPHLSANENPSRPLLGYRCWRLNGWTAQGPSELSALGSHWLWRPGPNKADCMVASYRAAQFGWELGHKSPAPAENCTCGLWMMPKYQDLYKTMYTGIQGAVLGWGRYVEHAVGFRCEYAQVIALCGLNPETRSYLSDYFMGVGLFPVYQSDKVRVGEALNQIFKRLAQTYDVPFFERWEDMVEFAERYAAEAALPPKNR